MNNHKGVLLGALIGTFIGSLTVLKRKEIEKIIEDHAGNVGQKTKKLTHFLMGEVQKMPWYKKHENNLFLKGSALGLIAGAGATMLLTPKTGKAVRGQLSNLYSDIMDNAKGVVEFVHNNSNGKTKAKPKKTTIARKTVTARSKKPVTKKPVTRKSATAKR